MKKFKYILFIIVVILITISLPILPTMGILQFIGISYSNWQSLLGFVILYIILNWITELILETIPPKLTGTLLYFFGHLISLLITDIIIKSVSFSLFGMLIFSSFFTWLEYLLDKHAD